MYIPGGPEGTGIQCRMFLRLPLKTSGASSGAFDGRGADPAYMQRTVLKNVFRWPPT